ncbi:uncharacterized protein LOC119185431 isoform X2 [Rhipicephalus microplus]|uniref:uncharacterized protein LOC119185431 isoform X2 n=1 Tax=Rhipicephalus microplus TaxID=6941 RepID=UPI003F6BFDE9
MRHACSVVIFTNTAIPRSALSSCHGHHERARSELVCRVWLRAVAKAARSPAVVVEARGAAIMEQWKRAKKAKLLAAAVGVLGVAMANYTPKNIFSTKL